MKIKFKLIFLCTAVLLLSGCASDKAIYRGQTLNGYPHGTGKKYWPDGSKYEGQWTNGAMDGNGALTMPDGRRYEGSFVNGEMSGQGSMQYVDGSSYEGAWFKGERSGQGRLKFADQSQYSGNWSSNVQSGQGTQEYSNGNVFMGNFANGQQNGEGAGVAYFYDSGSGWCFERCSQTSEKFAIVAGDFSNPDKLNVTPCGADQAKCKTRLAAILAALEKDRARRLAEAEREKARLAAEAEKEKARKEAALLAEQKRKEAEILAEKNRKEAARLALLHTGTPSQVYMHADQLESDKDYIQASEAYRIVVSRFPESSFAAAAMTRLGVMRDKRDQQEAEQRRLALEAEQHSKEEQQRKQDAAERKADRDAQSAHLEAMSQQQQKASSGAACVEAAKLVCDQTTSGWANTACKMAAGAGCN
ncbi:MAG TPA: hypothetical protein VMV48_11435 [Gallionellaceae bacterium]|nr:hypothetical protein [Gallionellaceae bacterium]